jgi:hypothetical protein
MVESILTVLEEHGPRKVRRQISQTKKRVMNKMQNTISKTFSQMSMEHLVWLHTNNKIAYPEHLQRRAVWEPMMKHLFMCSILSGMAISSLILLDIRTCVDWCKTFGTQDDVEYFEDLFKEGYIKICGDGQQKTIVYVEFCANRIRLNQHEFNYIKYKNSESSVEIDADGNTHLKYPFFPFTDESEETLLENWKEVDESWKFDFGMTPKYFQELPLEFQKALKEEKISICNVWGCTKQQSQILYNMINVGVHQTAQEFRNAFDCLIAYVIRYFADKYESHYKRIGINRKRLTVDENIVWKLELFTRRTIITDENIDGFKKNKFFEYSVDDWMYQNECKHEEVAYMPDPEHPKKLSPFEIVLKKNMESMDGYPEKINKWGWRQDLLWFEVLTWISERAVFGNNKKDLIRAFEIFFEQEVLRRSDLNTKVHKKEGTGVEYPYNGIGSKSDEKMMEKMFDIAINEFLINEEIQNMISPRSSTKRKPVYLTHKIAAWKKEKGISPVDDTEFPLKDVINDHLYELDHLIRLAEIEGEDIPENRFLISIEHHITKSKMESLGIKFKTKEDYKKILSFNRTASIPVSTMHFNKNMAA